jgi:hypothetical protein
VPREPHLHRHDGRRDRERDQALDQRPDPTGPASREATCAVTPISAASRNPDTFSALLCQDLLAEALSAAESSEDRCKGGCSLGHPLIPHLSRTTSKIGSDENRPGTEFTGQRHFPTFAAGHGIGPAQPLKVETRVQIPLGLRGKTAGQVEFDSDKPDARRPGWPDPARSCTALHLTAAREDDLSRGTVHQRPSFVPVTTCFASPRLLYRSSGPPPRKSTWLDR